MSAFQESFSVGLMEHWFESSFEHSSPFHSWSTPPCAKFYAVKENKTSNNIPAILWQAVLHEYQYMQHNLVLKKNKRTMMVLYRSPDQTDLHIYCWSFSQVSALGFLYKLYSTNHSHPPPPHPWPCFFTNLDDPNWILKEGHQRNISAKLYWNWSSGLKNFI